MRPSATTFSGKALGVYAAAFGMPFCLTKYPYKLVDKARQLYITSSSNDRIVQDELRTHAAIMGEIRQTTALELSLKDADPEAYRLMTAVSELQNCVLVVC